MNPHIPLAHCSRVLAIMVFATLTYPVPAAVLNVQILGHGDDQKGGSDPQPPAYQGAGVIGVQGDFWNGVPADSFGHPLTIAPPGRTLLADGKTATGVTLTFDGFLTADHWPTSQGAPVANALMNSYLACREGASVTIEGLVPHGRYDLCLFGNNSHAGAGAKFSVNNGSPQRTQGSAGEVFTKGTDYVEFKGVAADGDGQLTIAVDPYSAEIGIFNGFQMSGGFPAPAARSYRTSSRPRMSAKLPLLMDQRATFLADPMFSFAYHEQDSSELLGTWKHYRESRRLDAHRIQRVLTWKDPKTGLEVRKVGIEYNDYPAV